MRRAQGLLLLAAATAACSTPATFDPLAKAPRPSEMSAQAPKAADAKAAGPPGDPDDLRSDALHQVADARGLLEQQRYEEGLKALKAAIALDPSLSRLAPNESYERLTGLFSDLQVGDHPLRLVDLQRSRGEAATAGHNAIMAFADLKDMEAMLWASAALGVDPGKETFRLLLESISKRTAIPVVPEDVVSRAALVSRKLRLAEKAFLDQRFGEAALACQQALLLEPNNATAWVRLGSAQFAVGEKEKARRAYARALELEPDNAAVRRFMEKRGWQ